MTFKRLVITIVLAAFIFTLIPAALAAGGTISGKIAFPANTSTPMDINKTVDVTMMTIYAMNTNTGFVNATKPHADGTYSIPVPENGMYRIWVYPNEIIDATDYEHMLLAQYPDPGSRLYLITVNGNTNNVDISYYPADQLRVAEQPDPGIADAVGHRDAKAVVGLRHRTGPGRPGGRVRDRRPPQVIL